MAKYIRSVDDERGGKRHVHREQCVGCTAITMLCSIIIFVTRSLGE